MLVIAETWLCRCHGHDRVPDPDLDGLFQQLSGVNVAPVEPGTVGRAEVLDAPSATGNPEAHACQKRIRR